MKFLICIFVFVFCMFTQAERLSEQPDKLLSLGHLINKYTTANYGIKPSPSLIKAAEKGHSTAQLELAGVYFRKHSTFKNNKKASEEIEQSLYWFDKAAEQGNAKAQAILGTIYCCSNDENFRSKKGFFTKLPLVTENWYEAFYWFKRGTNLENLDAKYQLAHMHLSGIRVEKSSKIAIDLLRLLTNEGNKQARVNLNMTIIGSHHGSQEDLIEAFYSIERLARMGNVGAQKALGTIYIASEDDSILKEAPDFPKHLFPVDYKKAVYWYKKAVDQGSIVALLLLEELEKDKKVVLDPETKKQIESIDKVQLLADFTNGNIQ